MQQQQRTEMHINVLEHVIKYENIKFANITDAWIHNANVAKCKEIKKNNQETLRIYNKNEYNKTRTTKKYEHA